MKNIIAVVVITLMLAGCSTFALVNRHQLAAQIAVEAATARVLEAHPDWKSGAIGITGAAISAIDSSVLVSLAQVENYVKSKIEWVRFLPEEQAVISALIGEARAAIEEDLRAKNIRDPELELVEVRKFLTWINATAKRRQ